MESNTDFRISSGPPDNLVTSELPITQAFVFSSFIQLENVSPIELLGIVSRMENMHCVTNIENDLNDLTYLPEITLRQPTKERIVKMSRKEHVDAFFKHGKLRLGSLETYRQIEHAQIGDISEGNLVLILKNSLMSRILDLQCGYNHHVFCCYTGHTNHNVMQEFGYDDGFEIENISGFRQAISNTLNIKEVRSGECLYKNLKALVLDVPSTFNLDINFGMQLSQSLQLSQMAHYFLKNKHFSHQQEYRFVWENPNRVSNFIDIECPEAIQFCKRL
ncbi:MAG: hypothetical protein ACK551_03450 [Vampirovibrionales bacterium]